MKNKNMYLLFVLPFFFTGCQTPKEYPLNGNVCLEMYENEGHEYWKHPTLKELCLAMIEQAKVESGFSGNYPNENIPVNVPDDGKYDGKSNVPPQLQGEDKNN